jgi:hypothetical protein
MYDMAVGALVELCKLTNTAEEYKKAAISTATMTNKSKPKLKDLVVMNNLKELKEALKVVGVKYLHV